MKRLAKRIVCLALGLLLLAGTALASEAYGPEVYASELPLGSGAALHNRLFWSDIYSRLRAESYIAYTPNATVIPVVDFGTAVRGVTTPAQVEARLAAKGLTMAGGINGDYFVMATGENLGLLVTDGVLRATSSFHPAIGFYADGSAIIGTPQTTVRVTVPSGERFTIGDVNKLNAGSQAVLFTADYGADTALTGVCTNVILTAPSDALRLGGTVTATVEAVRESEGAVPLEAGKLVLTLNAEGDQWRRGLMQSLQPGDQISIEISAADERWNDVVYAAGGLHLLVENGEAIKGVEVNSAPRTAVGIREDGSLLFYTSASYTNGATTSLDQVAVRLQELGCVTALMLDGGGSATLSAAYPGNSGLSTVNKPSAGSLRSCSNYIVLASTIAADGVADSLWVYPYSVALLSGATYAFHASAADRALRLAALPSSLNWSVTGGVGSVTADGTFTAGAAGSGSVTVSGGGLTAGAAAVQVVSVPDAIEVSMSGVTLDDLTLSSGDSVALTATAFHNHVDLISQNSCFTWTLTDGLGTVDAEGVLTAGDMAGEGTLTVSAGGTTVSIPISVRGNPFPDMSGHWAEPYTTELYYLNLIRGIEDEGVMNYHPDENMNRAQFAVLMAAALGLDPAAYADTELPFADLATVPDWALGAVRALYAEGLMLGSGDGTAVSFHPYDPITRAEGATVIGRAFPAADGSATAEPADDTAGLSGDTQADSAVHLAVFPDAAEVPAWAAVHFDSLVARGVINGMDGKLSPLSNITRAQAAKMLCILLDA